MMYTRLLTDLERGRIRAYLRADGEKRVEMRLIVSRARRFLPLLEEDFALLTSLLKTYKAKARRSRRKARNVRRQIVGGQ